MKVIASLIATAALALSALVAVPSTANAAYPGTVTTRCGIIVPGKIQKNHNLFVSARVIANGNAHPRGKVIVRVYRVLKHGRLDFNRSASRNYAGPKWKTVSLGKFKRTGHYKAKVVFRPNRGSIYKASSSGLHSFRVVKHRR